MFRRRSYPFMLPVLFFVHSLSAQKNYTLTYKFVFASNDTLSVVWGSKVKLLVQDSISFTCNPDILEKLKISPDTLIGNTHLAKVTYCIAKKGISITPMGYLERPKQWRLGVKKLDRGQWKITDEQKQIAGFMCTRATGVINNRSCTVWFTNAFPGGYGPFILTSLPGAIFEIKYDDRGTSYIVVETSESVIPLKEPDYCKRVELH